MDKETLRKVQLVQLEIAKEIKRVCKENDIRYFLTAGTLLGAVRHKGFIPWDDDLDIGMLQEDYDKFCQIAPNALSSKYQLVNWQTDSYCGVPIGKVCKKGTIFQESKSYSGNTNGIYADIIVYHNAPVDSKSQQHLIDKLNVLERLILMKSHYRPWLENGKINYRKRLMYLPIQLLSCFFTRKGLINKHISITQAHPKTDFLYGQLGPRRVPIFKRSWFEKTHEVVFEDTTFAIFDGAENYLRAGYGDYMQLPPEKERENRHQVLELDFGEDK